MPEFDFTTTRNRRETGAIKWMVYADRPEVLPMWVADMEFLTPTPIRDAIQRRLDHAVLGYDKETDRLNSVVCRWHAERHDWAIDPSWLVWIPGVMPGVWACARMAQEGGRIASSTPIYPLFLKTPAVTDRTLQRWPLVKDDEGIWRMDLPALAERPPAWLLHCAPHNPTGRVWTQEEQTALIEVCLREKICICSDEIWADLVLDEPATPHRPLASLDDRIAAQTVTLFSASKTFNMAGLFTAYAVIPDQKLRATFRRNALGTFTHPNILGLAATEAAYTECEPWRQALLRELITNRDRVAEVVDALPGLAMTPGEATFLAWIDVRAWDVDDPKGVLEAHGLGLQDGKDFGQPGWLRLNFGCPAAMVETGLNRLRAAVRPQ